MSVPGGRGLGGLLTLGLCLLAVACGGERAATPYPLAAVPPPRPNLLRNTGFLHDTSGWQVGPAPLPAAIDPTYEEPGFVTLAVDPGVSPVSAGWSQSVAVDPEVCYLVSYRARTEKLSGSADLRLSFYDGGGRLLAWTGVLPIAGTSDWATYAWRLRAPTGATRAQVSLDVTDAASGRASFAEPYLGPDDAPLTRALIVDYGYEAGRVRSFQQASAAAVPPAALAESARLLALDHLRPEPGGATPRGPHEALRLVGSPAAGSESRLGNPGLADLRLIFPDPQADPGNPASYDWAASDATLAAVAPGGATPAGSESRLGNPGGATPAGLPGRLGNPGGAEILFRLGESPDPEGKRPRLDATRWAEVARHVVMHYNEGWGGGHRYGIRYWEVASDPAIGACGQGAAEDCYALLATAIEELQAYNPNLKVGGPALATPAHILAAEGLLRYLAERGVRPDFFSWQSEGNASPQALALAEARFERLLDRYGFGDAEVIVSAWRLAGGSAAWRSGPYGAAYLVAGETYWQDTRLAQAYYGGATPEAQSDLWEASGTPTCAGQALAMLGRFKSTPRRLVAQGGDDLGFTLLAGKSEDGRLVHILIADTGSRSAGYRLGLAAFPPGFRYTVTEIAQGCPAQVIASGEAADLQDRVIALPWHSPAVQLVQVAWP